MTLVLCAPDTKKKEVATPKKAVVSKAPKKSKASTNTKTFSASANEIIQPATIDILLLEKLVLDEVNKIKRVNNQPILKHHSTLRNAAVDQNNYQIRLGDISHTQKSSAKASLGKRVSHYGGGFQAMAENVLYAGFIIRTTGTKKQIIAPSYQEHAKTMVRNWMESPGHRKNIMNPKYDRVGTAIGYNADLHAVFSTQVFGKAM